jgi:beta-lactamase regulating signal transducer with metallopeptidase domain
MDILAESALRITVLAVGVSVVLRVLRIRSPRLTHGVWTAVVVIMLLLPAFVASGPELALPLLPSYGVSDILVPASGDVAAAAPAEEGASSLIAPAAAARSPQGITWLDAAWAIYAVGAGFFLLRFALGWQRARAIRRGAVHAQGRLMHPLCATPITVGVVAPAVILPVDWASWDDAELAAVLAHEEEHVRRYDPLVAAIVLLNRAIFWFHPLAWWLQREIAGLSEQACDAAVISRGHDSELYASCLLRFARRVNDAGGRIAPVAIAMPGAGLQERLAVLARPEAAHPSRSRLACAAAACAAVAVVSAAASPAAAPVQDRPPLRNQTAWAVHMSDHFQIFHDGLPADRLDEAVSDAEAAYSRLSAALKHDMPRPVTIVLVRRDRDLAPQARGIVPPGADPTEQRIVISLESLDRRTGVIAHELTHQFAFEIVPDTSRAAPVLIEGLAEHQRGIWEAEDMRKTWDAAEAGSIPSVAAFAMTDRHWAHAMFDFVAARHGTEGVRQLLFALRAQEKIESAVPMAFGVTLDQFNQDFRGYVTTRFGQF